ncbi:TetR/AcrR family transcriptional regulator [Streptacidiphilus melanogenes]|uniref:TetR/AcrR family transcriptional regulator n=1 Tax=Streptacidiphilus melanogenes TaxID=411235 RepID=UPI0005A7E276|nr:TetR/AcrR family transcriptional regulator [Streptacidiphilus melanogenes]
MTPPSEPISLSPEARPADGRAVLPLYDQDPTERADAARNRAKLLQAAATLIQEQGAEHLTMDAVASAACVGKGTVFRRFGDRVGLLFAVLDQTESAFQNAFMFGPPPLGPDADPVTRLEAFGVASLRHMSEHMNLYLEADQQAAARYGAPPRRVRTRHLTMLLQQAGVQGDAELLAETLLGTLDPSFVHHLLTNRGRTAPELEAGWCDLVARVTHRC